MFIIEQLSCLARIYPKFSNYTKKMTRPVSRFLICILIILLHNIVVAVISLQDPHPLPSLKQCCYLQVPVCPCTARFPPSRLFGFLHKNFFLSCTTFTCLFYIHFYLSSSSFSILFSSLFLLFSLFRFPPLFLPL
jgi:hypothetical protein